MRALRKYCTIAAMLAAMTVPGGAAQAVAAPAPKVAYAPQLSVDSFFSAAEDCRAAGHGVAFHTDRLDFALLRARGWKRVGVADPVGKGRLGLRRGDGAVMTVIGKLQACFVYASLPADTEMNTLVQQATERWRIDWGRALGYNSYTWTFDNGRYVLSDEGDGIRKLSIIFFT